MSEWVCVCLGVWVSGCERECTSWHFVVAHGITVYLVALEME